jgi:manganese/zinc/iron transport system permease protein
VPEVIRLLLFDYTVRTVALGAVVLGIVSGVLGCFAILRRQSLFGDALAHAALPGVCLAFMLTGAKQPLALLIGAALSGWIGALAVLGIVRGSRIKEDAALGIVLTVFFGLGIVLLTRIQRTGNASQSGLNHFLFGQAAVLLQRDVLLMAGLGAVTLAVVALLYKEFKLLAFDPAFGSSLGYPMGRLGVLLTALITVAVVIGLQSVGVVLMAALLIAPAAAARQWTDRLSVMIGLSATFGAVSGLVGAVLSSVDARVPTGPLVILLATAIVVVSLTVAPRRGLVWTALRRRRTNRRLARERVLADLAPFAGQGQVIEPALLGASARAGLSGLARPGLVESAGGARWRLTEEGRRQVAAADRRRQHRRAELARQLHVAETEIHLDATDLSRALPEEVLHHLDADTAPEDAAVRSAASPTAPAPPTTSESPAARRGS